MNKAVIRAGLETLYLTRSHVLFRRFLGGVGAILTLHHVRRPKQGGFQPNRLLEIAPEFLETIIERLRADQIDLISLDEMHSRLTTQNYKRRFVCFTFDDGYRDNLEFAYPILKHHGVPFALYVPTSFPDQIGELWWLALETVIAQRDRIGLLINGEEKRFDCADRAEKQAVYELIYWWLRGLPTERELRHAIHDLCKRYDIEITAICRQLCMTWAEIAQLAADPLVTIGAHTVNHVMLKKVPEQQAASEMKMSATVIEAALGIKPRHLSYPVGDVTSAGPREFRLARDAGFVTAVTTRPGVLFPEHRDHLTALPRISLNGEFQRVRYVDVLLSGAATAINNRFRHVNAA